MKRSAAAGGGLRGRRRIHEEPGEDGMTCRSTGLHTCREERKDQLSDSDPITQERRDARTSCLWSPKKEIA